MNESSVSECEFKMWVSVRMIVMSGMSKWEWGRWVCESWVSEWVNEWWGMSEWVNAFVSEWMLSERRMNALSVMSMREEVMKAMSETWVMSEGWVSEWLIGVKEHHERSTLQSSAV
ncbi:hypothetical protein DPMN_097510 [Dreissena polymorpha]|uniref:Uncharacterized protein n=1 Tax=Dreissena polymorpha TaxID=45954 RepID=A0A9D4LDE7_DREPO|nr:hypothetical protein DPMN_097510 [Dreissena polymorpha]